MSPLSIALPHYPGKRAQRAGRSTSSSSGASSPTAAGGRRRGCRAADELPKPTGADAMAVPSKPVRKGLLRRWPHVHRKVQAPEPALSVSPTPRSDASTPDIEPKAVFETGVASADRDGGLSAPRTSHLSARERLPSSLKLKAPLDEKERDSLINSRNDQVRDEADVICRVAATLGAVAAEGDPAESQEFSNLKGSKVTVPKVSLSMYLARLVVYLTSACADEEAEKRPGAAPTPRQWAMRESKGLTFLLFAVQLIARSDLVLTTYNLHRVCAIAMFIANQILDDVSLSLADYAAIAGIQVNELAELQTNFCRSASFRLSDVVCEDIDAIKSAFLLGEAS